uniref:ARAD1C43670p n=1 Tax=Blastobotrys adeninivorans TaxID=409370 RepID=A0A060TA87_BLAAD
MSINYAIPDAPRFDGARGADRWIEELEEHLNYRGLTRDQDKVVMAAICLEGPVEQWFNDLMKSRTNTDQWTVSGPTEQLPSWQEFKHLIQSEYQQSKM